LLALLLVHANRAVTTDRLIDDLWEGEPPDAALATLQSHISYLRKVLGADRIRTQGGGYVLVVADGELDANAFEGEVAAARRGLEGDPAEAAEVLTSALGRWRGTPWPTWLMRPGPPPRSPASKSYAWSPPSRCSKPSWRSEPTPT
jgi:DNA-binding SARP family transcriptional activator